MAHAQLGEPETASASFEQARAIYRQLDHHGLTALASLAELQLVGLVYMADDRQWCDQRATESRQAIDQASGAFPPGFPATIGEVPLMVLRGLWNEASDLLTETVTPENTFHRFVFAEARARIAFWRGQYEDAWKEVRQAMPLGAGQPWQSRQLQEGLFFQRLAIDLCLASGDLPTAETWLASLREWVMCSGAMTPMADVTCQSARYALAAGNADEARALAIESLDQATRLGQPLAQLAAHRVLAEVDRLGRHDTAALDQLELALVLARRCEAAHATASILTSLAELHDSRGDSALARTTSEEALAIASCLRAAPLLQRLAVVTREHHEVAMAQTLHGLTSREIEVLRLVAQGLTDVAVAAQLFISPRTVGQHLRSIYGKINVSTRSAATRFAMEHDLA
jgi:DNA-binding CsgD family transcriptional regulator